MVRALGAGRNDWERTAPSTRGGLEELLLLLGAAALVFAAGAVGIAWIWGQLSADQLKWEVLQAASAVNSSYANNEYAAKPVVFAPPAGYEVEYCLLGDGQGFGIRGSSTGLFASTAFFSSQIGGPSGEDPCAGLSTRPLPPI